jgi:hypothetical protein
MRIAVCISIYDGQLWATKVSGMSKSSRPSVPKPSSFDIRSIPKKPPAPSLDRRRGQDAFRMRVKANKGKH